MKTTLKELLMDRYGNGLINVDRNNIIIREIVKLFGCDGENVKVNIYSLPLTPYATMFIPKFKMYLLEQMGAKILEDWDEIWDREIDFIDPVFINDEVALAITLKEIVIDDY